MIAAPKMCGQIAIARLCNVRHTFCFQTDFSPRPRLSDDVLFDKLRPLYERVDKIRLLGGEPLAIPGFKDYVTWLTDNYPLMNIEVATNALALDGFWIDLAKSRPVVFKVSLNAVTDETAAKIFKSGDGAKLQRRILANLEALAAADHLAPKPLLMSVSMVLNPDTAPDLAPMAAWALANGANLVLQNMADMAHNRLGPAGEELALRALKVSYFCRDYIDGACFHTPPRVLETFQRELAAGRYEAEKAEFLAGLGGASRNSKTPLIYYNDYVEPGLRPEEERPKTPCRMPEYGFHIGPGGEFHVCCHTHHYPLGNVHANPLEELIGGGGGGETPGIAGTGRAGGLPLLFAPLPPGLRTGAGPRRKIERGLYGAA